MKINQHNMKFRVNNPQHSNRIQREGRRLGFYFLGLKKPTYYMKPFLFFDWNDMSITWDDNELRFNEHPYTETTLEELKLM